VLVAAIVSAAFLFRDTLFGTAVDVYVVARHDIVQTVVATGRVTTPQRVSAGAVVIARSLAMNPALVLADEINRNVLRRG
jgi:ABC-type ATPase involved in cell division